MKYYKPVFRFFKRPVKKIKLLLKQKAGWLEQPIIIPFRGYGNHKLVFIRGRVLEDSGLAKPSDRQNVWKNILATLKRFFSDEIAGVHVKARFNGLTQYAKTDEFGFFSFSFKTESKYKRKQWLNVDFTLMDRVMEGQPEVTATGEVLIIPPSQMRMIISDIDDTVLVSHSTQTLKKLRLMLFKNALTRLPFEGVVDFYQMLEKGKSGHEDYPLFFVSSSEWNLYDLLEDFFKHNHVPKSVLILRKLENSIYKFWKSGGGSHEHKYEEIKFLLEFFSSQNLILIGDNGQKDPEIYTRLAKEFPDRIEAIYIRKINSRKPGNPVRKDTELPGSETYYKEVENSLMAIEHARKSGFIAV